MSILAVIPARLGATRLPRKPLRLLGGRPLIVRVWERVSAMRVADRCVIATDSADVATIARDAGAECMMTRTEHLSGTDRVAEVAAASDFAAYDTIVNVQGDEPFVSAEAVRGAATLVADGRFPLGTAAAPATLDELLLTDVVKVVTDDTGRAMYFSRAPIPFLRDASESPLLAGHVWRHLGIYAYGRDALAAWVRLPPHPLERIERLEQLRPLADGVAMGVALVTDAPPGGIDTEEDLRRANARWTDFQAGVT